jgi:hypothetical protein
VVERLVDRTSTQAVHLDGLLLNRDAVAHGVPCGHIGDVGEGLRGRDTVRGVVAREPFEYVLLVPGGGCRVVLGRSASEEAAARHLEHHLPLHAAPTLSSCVS